MRLGVSTGRVIGFLCSPKQNIRSIMKKLLQFITLTGWLLPTAVAGIYFGRWIKEIVIPTLKGGDFVQLYDLHQVRYLDTTQACVIVAFIWITLVVFQLARKNLRGTRS
jgi:hypothetical protein